MGGLSVGGREVLAQEQRLGDDLGGRQTSRAQGRAALKNGGRRHTNGRGGVTRRLDRLRRQACRDEGRSGTVQCVPVCASVGACQRKSTDDGGCSVLAWQP